MLTFTTLNSSMCNGCCIDPVESAALLVRFSNGKVYRYIGAGERFDALVNAESAGKYVNASLKSHYNVERAQEYE